MGRGLQWTVDASGPAGTGRVIREMLAPTARQPQAQEHAVAITGARRGSGRRPVPGCCRAPRHTSSPATRADLIGRHAGGSVLSRRRSRTTRRAQYDDQAEETRGCLPAGSAASAVLFGLRLRVAARCRHVTAYGLRLPSAGEVEVCLCVASSPPCSTAPRIAVHFSFTCSRP